MDVVCLMTAYLLAEMVELNSVFYKIKIIKRKKKKESEREDG